MNNEDHQGLDEIDFRSTLSFMSESRLVIDISFVGLLLKSIENQ